MSEFEKLLVDLATNEVRFIVVGGLAVAYCGYVRATDDLDLLIDPQPDNVRRLLRVLESFGDGSAEELDASDFRVEEGAIRVIEAFPVNLFTQMSGYTYNDLIGKTDERSVQDVSLRHLNPDGLILLKKDSYRPKDQLDVQALQQIQQNRIQQNNE